MKKLSLIISVYNEEAVLEKFYKDFSAPSNRIWNTGEGDMS